MNESIIKISTPLPKVQLSPPLDELQPEITQTQEINLLEKLQQPEPELEPEPINVTQSTSTRFAIPHSNGWRVSDILREIRLDNFEMGSAD